MRGVNAMKKSQAFDIRDEGLHSNPQRRTHDYRKSLSPSLDLERLPQEQQPTSFPTFLEAFLDLIDAKEFCLSTLNLGLSFSKYISMPSR
jgi:hypothetical protein